MIVDNHRVIVLEQRRCLEAVSDERRRIKIRSSDVRESRGRRRRLEGVDEDVLGRDSQDRARHRVGVDGGESASRSLPGAVLLEASKQAGPRVERVVAVQVWATCELERQTSRG